jgi:hypothetical protein
VIETATRISPERAAELAAHGPGAEPARAREMSPHASHRAQVGGSNKDARNPEN